MAMVTDPVCGMTFDSSQAQAQTTHNGVSYYFCSEECRKTFEQNPKDYISSGSGGTSTGGGMGVDGGVAD
jgi:YHS domain-containing protein